MEPDHAAGRICDYLKKQHVLSLAAANAEGTWCASCFYVFDAARMSFIVMTETSTRHGSMMIENPRISGTVVTQPRIVGMIRGFQFSGKAVLLEEEDAAAARKMYCRRFPVALAMKSPVWRLEIDYGKLTDNTLGFGTKLTWERPASSSTL